MCEVYHFFVILEVEMPKLQKSLHLTTNILPNLVMLCYIWSWQLHLVQPLGVNKIRASMAGGCL